MMRHGFPRPIKRQTETPRRESKNSRYRICSTCSRWVLGDSGVRICALSEEKTAPVDSCGEWTGKC